MHDSVEMLKNAKGVCNYCNRNQKCSGEIVILCRGRGKQSCTIKEKVNSGADYYFPWCAVGTSRSRIMVENSIY